MVATKQYPHQSPLADVFSGNWQDYFEISDHYSAEEKQLLEKQITVLSQKSPEFQEMMRASQNLYATHYLNGLPKENQKIIIQPPDEKYYGRAYAYWYDRVMVLDLQAMAGGTYKNLSNGQREDFF